MNDRSATTTKDTLFRATSIQPATLIRTFAVGLHQGQRTWFPRKQAGHMTASRQPVQNVEKKTLANQGRPHMARRVGQHESERGQFWIGAHLVEPDEFCSHEGAVAI